MRFKLDADLHGKSKIQKTDSIFIWKEIILEQGKSLNLQKLFCFLSYCTDSSLQLWNIIVSVNQQNCQDFFPRKCTFQSYNSNLQFLHPHHMHGGALCQDIPGNKEEIKRNGEDDSIPG